MMKKIIFSLIFLCILMGDCHSVKAMQDDSNTKVFELKPESMLGMNDAIPNDDTKLAAQLTNFVLSPSGLFTWSLYSTTFPVNYTLPTGRKWGTIYEVPGESYPYIAGYNDAAGGSVEIYIINSSTLTLLTVEVGISDPSIYAIKKVYNGGDYSYILLPKGLYRAYSVLNTKVTTPWTTAIAGALWQGRMIAAEEWYSGAALYSNRIWWSSASNPEDWTIAVNHGGYLDLPVNEKILALHSTLQGLIILTNGGAWVLSGPSPDSWQLDKILSLKTQVLNFGGIGAVPISDSKLAFIDFYSNLNIIENLQFNQIGSVPRVDTGDFINDAGTEETFLFYTMAYWDNRYIVIPEYRHINSNPGEIHSSSTARIFDMSSKTWSEFTGILSASASWVIMSDNKLYQRATLKPNNAAPVWTSNAYYLSTSQTMDDNHQTLKDVVRMEIDCQAKNSTTFEVGLKNDAVSASKIFTSATDNTTSYVFYPKLGSASRDHQCWFKSSSASQIKGIRLYYIERGNLKVNGGK